MQIRLVRSNSPARTWPPQRCPRPPTESLASGSPDAREPAASACADGGRTSTRLPPHHGAPRKPRQGTGSFLKRIRCFCFRKVCLYPLPATPAARAPAVLTRLPAPRPRGVLAEVTAEARHKVPGSDAPSMAGADTEPRHHGPHARRLKSRRHARGAVGRGAHHARAERPPQLRAPLES